MFLLQCRPSKSLQQPPAAAGRQAPWCRLAAGQGTLRCNMAIAGARLHHFLSLRHPAPCRRAQSRILAAMGAPTASQAATTPSTGAKPAKQPACRCCELHSTLQSCTASGSHHTHIHQRLQWQDAWFLLHRRCATAGSGDWRGPGGPSDRAGAVRPFRRGHSAGAGRRGGRARQRRRCEQGPGRGLVKCARAQQWSQLNPSGHGMGFVGAVSA
jgi:hypothetical protein